MGAGPEVRALLHELNALDKELYEYGVALHEDGDVEVSFPAPRSRGGGSNVSPFLRNIACLFACATDSSTISATDRPFFCFVYTVLLL